MAQGVRRALIFASTVPVMILLVPKTACAQAHMYTTPANPRIATWFQRPRVQQLSHVSTPYVNVANVQ